jgi:hypothetical protein
LSEFPPSDLASFLRLCDGEWLTVRSRFQLEDPGPAARDPALPLPGLTETPAATQQGPFAVEASESAAAAAQESWHDSARGSLQVSYLEPGDPAEPGGLLVTPPAHEGRPGEPQRLSFQAEGAFECLNPAGMAIGTGRWELWSDGSLELTQEGAGSVVRERIWFTKPNLRLRSSVERYPDGTPARASFSSEIRRVSRPAS